MKPSTILAIAAASVVVGVAVTRRRRPKKRNGTTKGVQLYGASWCPACMELKNDLTEGDIPFTFRDIDSDRRADSFIMAQTEEGIIPVTTVNGTTIIGYKPDEVVAAYRELSA